MNITEDDEWKHMKIKWILNKTRKIESLKKGKETIIVGGKKFA